MTSFIFVVVFVLLNPAALFSQTQAKPKAQEPVKAAAITPLKPEELVHEWFKRFNALDGSEAAVNNFVELYQPAAVQLMGPQEGQIGPVLYEGQRLIRGMAEQLSKKYTRLAYYVKSRTVQAKTGELMYASTTPWGESAIVVEFGGSYDMRDSGKRFMVSGAAFFELQEGKISRLRLYHAAGETMEVKPPFTAGCGN